jgi:GNAT superfamily N-acetyltransferase
VSRPHFVVTAFIRAHARRAFTCGHAVLDRYWRERANQDLRRDVATIFTLIDIDAEAVAGFYTVSAASVHLANLPAVTQSALPMYPQVPVVLLGRLAIATAYQGHGLGAMLVYDAAQRVRASGIGCFALVTDPIDRPARDFYQHLGFLAVEDDRRLFAPIRSLLSDA